LSGDHGALALRTSLGSLIAQGLETIILLVAAQRWLLMLLAMGALAGIFSLTPELPTNFIMTGRAHLWLQ